MDNSYLKIANHYSELFSKYGDVPQGYDWSNEKDMETRYKVMRGLFNPLLFEKTSVLDFGCGAGGFYDYIKRFSFIEYSGIDINEFSIKKARAKFPTADFGLLDIHSEEGEWAFNNPRICKQEYDYIICNGTFTVKRDLTQNQMNEFMCSTLEKLWTKTNKGIAFNVMSKLVDWERDDLFHVSMDQLCQWLLDNLSRNFIIRNDYGLYEYTIYVYK
jgi:SAM-dependent methyltransferase